MSTLVVKRIWIERSECTGHTLCGPEAPDLIELDQSGDTSTVKQGSLRNSQQELAWLIAASEVCPMRAFRVETEDGRIHCVPDDRAVRDALKQGDFRWSGAVAGSRGIAPVA
jgi:ferredoxin